jgi:hypothetical protein
MNLTKWSNAAMLSKAPKIAAPTAADFSSEAIVGPPGNIEQRQRPA